MAAAGLPSSTEDTSFPPPTGSFVDATVMDAAQIRRAAATMASFGTPITDSVGPSEISSSLMSFADGAAIATDFAEQLATQGFVRLKARGTMPSSELSSHKQAEAWPAVSAAQAMAASVFQRTRVEKLGLSNRLWEPEPAARCICIGYCAQDCARE